MQGTRDSAELKHAIIVGASSGIGYELAKVLSQHGYSVGLAARRIELLVALQQELPGFSCVVKMDVTSPTEVFEGFEHLIGQLGGLDLCIIAAGTGFFNPDLDWGGESETIDVNVRGFCAAANLTMHYFMKQSSGHLVGISSVAALRGGAVAPAYHASKAFVSNYMEGLRQKVVRLRLPIVITDIQPGFVDTALVQGSRLFWVSSPQKAARQIYRAIERQVPHAYISRRWRIIAWLMKLVPLGLYSRL